MEIETMIKWATEGQTTAETAIRRSRRYYSGIQGVLHSARQDQYLGEVETLANDTLDKQPDSFGNICKRAIGVINDRLKIEPDGTGLIASDSEGADYASAASDWWQLEDLNTKQVELHRNALRDRESALVVEWDGDHPSFTVQPIWDGVESSGVRFFYDSRGQLLFASKHWLREDNDTLTTDPFRVNFYEPGRIWRGLIDLTGNFRMMSGAEVSEETGEAVTENPQGFPVETIPVIHFKNFPYVSELTDIIKIQRVINHSLGSIDIAFDYHGAPGFTAEEFNQVRDTTGTEVPQAYGPEKVLVGKGMSRVPPPELVQMWESGVDRWVDMISLVKGWPMWLLNPRVAIPSGIALRMLEAPLVAQVQDKQFAFSSPWIEAFEVARQLHNYYNTAKQLSGNIKLAWQSPATVDVLESRKIEVETAQAAQLPMEWIWREIYGLDEDQIEEIKGWKVENAPPQINPDRGALLARAEAGMQPGDNGSKADEKPGAGQPEVK